MAYFQGRAVKLPESKTFLYPPGNDHISSYQGMFEDEFRFPKVGYVSSLEGIPYHEGITLGFS